MADMHPNAEGITRDAVGMAESALTSPARALTLIRAANIVTATLALNSPGPAGALERLLTEFDCNSRQIFNRAKRDLAKSEGKSQ